METRYKTVFLLAVVLGGCTGSGPLYYRNAAPPPSNALSRKDYPLCREALDAKVISKWEVRSIGNPTDLTLPIWGLVGRATPVQLAALDVRKGSASGVLTVWFGGEIGVAGWSEAGPVAVQGIGWGLVQQTEGVYTMLNRGWFVQGASGLRPGAGAPDAQFNEAGLIAEFFRADCPMDAPGAPWTPSDDGGVLPGDGG